MSTSTKSSATERSENVAVLFGIVTSDVMSRELPGGHVVAQFDLATHLDDAGKQTTVSVPLAWHDPTVGDLSTITRGAHVAVIGSVRRRFFRAGATTQSRTEVVVARVIPTTRSKSLRSAITAVTNALNQAVG